MDEVLDGALTVFRERGYDGASLGELGTAMKLTPGSIYKAFDGKKALFLAAFDRYVEGRHMELLRRGAEWVRVCLVVAFAAEVATIEPEMADRVRAALRRAERAILDLVREGQADRSIPSTVDAEACAYLLSCAVQGFRVAGKTGRKRAEAMAAVEQAMRLVA